MSEKKRKINMGHSVVIGREEKLYLGIKSM
jgi:hypothetical protein